MSLLLGLIRREFATRPRRRFFYWRRFGLIILFLIWLLCNYLIGLLGGRAGTVGLVLFSSLAKVTMLAVFLISPLIAGDLLMREKEERTLGLLYLTAITPGQLMAAKLFTALLTSGALALGVLPLFVLSVSLGGIATEQILLAFLLLACTIFGATGLGLWAGTRARNNQTMGSLLVVVMLVVGIALPSVFSFLYHETKWLTALDFWPVDRWLAVLSPYLAMTQIASGADLRGARWACLANLLFGLSFLLLAARALPHRLTEEPAAVGTILARWRGRKALRPHGRYPPPAGNPVLWRDYYFLHGGPRRIWGSFLTVAAVIALLFVLCPLTANQQLPRLGSLAIGYFWTMVGFSVVLGGLGFIGSHARCLSAERPGRVLDLLLTTDLDGAEILRGKQGAICHAFVPWVLMALTGAGIGLGMLLREIGKRPGEWWEFLYLCVMMCFPAVTAFGFSAVGLYFALRLPRFATVATFGALIATLMLQQFTTVLVIMLPMRFLFTGGPSSEVMRMLMMLGAALTLLVPPLVLGVVLRTYLYARFRALATTMTS